MTTSEITKTKTARATIKKYKICAGLEVHASAIPLLVFDPVMLARVAGLTNPSASATVDVEFASAPARLSVAGADDDVGLAPHGFVSLPWGFACGPYSCEVHDATSCWIAGEDAASGVESVVDGRSSCSAFSGTGASLSWIDFASPGEGAAPGADANATAVDLLPCIDSSEGVSLCWIDFTDAGEDAAARSVFSDSSGSVLIGGLFPSRAKCGSLRPMGLALSDDVNFGFDDSNRVCGKRGAVSPDVAGTGVAAALGAASPDVFADRCVMVGCRYQHL